jgi:hypothetical protein
MRLSTTEDKLSFIADLRKEKLQMFSESKYGLELREKLNVFPGIDIPPNSFHLYDTIRALNALPKKREEENQRYLPRFVLSWSLSVLSLMIVAVTDISFLASVWFIAIPIAVLALVGSVVFLKRNISKIRQTHQALEDFDKFVHRDAIQAVHLDDIALLDALHHAFNSLGTEGATMLQDDNGGDLERLSSDFMTVVLAKRRVARDSADGFHTKGAAATGLALGALAFAALPAIEFMLGTAVFFPPDIIFIAAVVALTFIVATLAACYFISHYYIEKHKLSALEGAPVKTLEAQHSRMFHPIQLSSLPQNACSVDTYAFGPEVFSRA